MEQLSFKMSDEQVMLLESAERFARDANAQHPVGAGNAQDGPFSRQRWGTLAELGWLALTTPEDAGGIGGSTADLAVLMRGVGPAMLREPLITSSVLAITLIEKAVPPAIGCEMMEAAAGGDVIFAVAHEEVASFRPDTVIATETSGGYVLSGTSVACWNAPGADVLLVMARHGTACGLPALFAVNADVPGITRETYEVVDGSFAADLLFDNVHVDADALLASGVNLQAAFVNAMDRATIAHAAKILGIMNSIIEQTSAFLNTREQFGGPLARFQALQHRVAEMFVRYQDATAALEFAIRAFDDGAPDNRQMLVSAAKVVIADAARYIGSQGIQLHGAIGVTEEYQIGHFYRNILFFEKMYGDTSYHLSRYDAIKTQQG